MLSRLVVHLQSNTKHLTNGLKGARSRVRGFALATKAAMGIAAGAAAGFVGFKMLQGQMQQLDKTAKLAQQTGFGAATIAGLGFAAEQTGADVSVLETALQKFTRRMGDAANRGGPVAETLKRIGQPIGTLQGLSPDEQFLRISEAISKIDDPGKRAAATFDLFGRQGQDLINMFANGRAGMEGFIAEADKLGLGFDAEQLASVEAANDAVNRVKRSMGALWSQVAIAAAPTIEFIAGGLLWIVQKAQAGFAMVKAAGGAVWDWIMQKIQPLMPLIQQVQAVGSAYFTMLKQMGVAAFGSIMSTGATLWSFIQSGLSSVMGWFGVSFGDILESGVTAFAMLEFGFLNWQAVGQLAFLSTGLAAVRFFNQVVHFFTGTLPALLNWFGSNWTSIWQTSLHFVDQVFQNLYTNVTTIMGQIWDFIASGGTASFEVAWTPLTDGFVNMIEKLPDIPARVMGPVEKALNDEVTALGSGLNKGMQALVAERLSQLDDFKNRTEAELPDVAALNGDDEGGTDEDSESGSGSTSKGLGSGLARGSEAALKAIFASQRQDKTAAQSLAEQKKQTGKLNEIAAKPTVELQEAGPE